MTDKPSYTTSPTADTTAFQEAIINWFNEVAEDYPWRRTIDPYEVLVSEVMLQQTTVQAVIENRRFEKFLMEFPDVYSLAEAGEEQILRAWEGLGYYNRVRNLQKTARAVVSEYRGEFPSSLEELKSLPGIGPYTSAAVASFAFNVSAPLVDANVSRVFSRLFDDASPVNTPAGQKTAWERAAILVSQTDVRSYNGGLMELGQKVCRNKKVLCDECCVSRFCATQEPLTLPTKKPKQKTIEITEYALWATQKNGALFMQKGDGSRRKGMWTLPLVDKESVAILEKVLDFKYAITRYKVNLKVYQSSPEDIAEIAEGEWVPLGELVSLPMPSPIRKVVDQLSYHFNG